MTPTAPRLRYQLLAATFTRLIMNIPHRMIYPFIGAFSRGLGVSTESIASLLAVRGGLGITSPFFGVIPDRLGRRSAMLIGLSLFCGGLLLVALFPNYYTFCAAIILVTVCKFIFDPALQAYLSDHTPYSQRGLIIGLSELGWSGAALIGFPLLGFIIARGGWQTPLWPLAALGGGCLILMGFVIPRDDPHPGKLDAARAGAASPNLMAALRRNPRLIAALSVGSLSSAANETLGVVYGLWLEQTFHLSLAALGLSVAIAIGFAELAGEGLVITLADRLGKRRAIALGLGASVLGYVALPFLNHYLPLALVGLFFIFIAFEVAVVTSISLVSELMPEARSTMMSGNVAGHAAGRMLGALIGPVLFSVGFIWNGALAALLNLIALGVIVAFVREKK